jgi:hypothetical protein
MDGGYKGGQLDRYSHVVPGDLIIRHRVELGPVYLSVRISQNSRGVSRLDASEHVRTYDRSTRLKSLIAWSVPDPLVMRTPNHWTFND